MDKQNDENNDHFDDDSDARDALEFGSGGFLRDGKFPTIRGNSERAQIIKGTIGPSEDDYIKSLEYEQQVAGIKVHINKRANPRKTKTFDAQNRRDRNIFQTSDQFFKNPRDIRRDEFINLYNAISFANHQGKVLNAFITICWEMLGIKTKTHSREKSEYYPLFTKPLSDWFSKRGIPFLWVYCNEYSSKSKFHTHFLLHIPVDYQAELHKYLQKRFKNINKNPSFDEKSINIKIDKKSNVYKQWIRFQYLCKGTDRKAIIGTWNSKVVKVHDLIQFRYENPGNMHHIRRICICDHLGPTLRMNKYFESPLDVKNLNIDSIYPKVTNTPKPYKWGDFTIPDPFKSKSTTTYSRILD